jgi:hypothetical protein
LGRGGGSHARSRCSSVRRMSEAVRCDHCGMAVGIDDAKGWIGTIGYGVPDTDEDPLNLDFCCLDCLGEYLRETHPHLANQSPPKS